MDRGSSAGPSLDPMHRASFSYSYSLFRPSAIQISMACLIVFSATLSVVLFLFAIQLFSMFLPRCPHLCYADIAHERRGTA